MNEQNGLQKKLDGNNELSAMTAAYMMMKGAYTTLLQSFPPERARQIMQGLLDEPLESFPLNTPMEFTINGKAKKGG